jgi:drug/metabolite transporter (DMT)-like permease
MQRPLETVMLTALALLAFAFNSILTRMALGGGHMDAASFTTVRLVSGALVLVVLARVKKRAWVPLRGHSVVGPLALFAYAVSFSFAYLRIGAAAGALLAFGAVQLTMVGGGMLAGERPRRRTWLGLVLAAGGLAWLTLPAVGRPDPVGSALMILAGCAWGVYSLAGRRSPDALASNARNFLWTVPLVLLLDTLMVRSAAVNARGVVLGLISGGITSGLGYAIWYRALRGLTATRAAILQLSVPVIAALGAIVLLDERLTARLALAGIAVLGGVCLALTDRKG